MGGFLSVQNSSHCCPPVFLFNGNQQPLWWKAEGAAEVWDPISWPVLCGACYTYCPLSCALWTHLAMRKSVLRRQTPGSCRARHLPAMPTISLPCPPSLLLLPRAHASTYWLNQMKSGPVLSAKDPHRYFLYQTISVQISEFSTLPGPGAGIPPWFIWSSMQILEDV